jgi:hypothetical protein
VLYPPFAPSTAPTASCAPHVVKRFFKGITAGRRSRLSGPPPRPQFTTQAWHPAGFNLLSAPSRGGARPGPSHRDSSATPLREPGLPLPDPARTASDSFRGPKVTLLPKRPGAQARTRTRITRPTRPSATAATRPATSLSQLWTARGPELYLMADSRARAGAVTIWTPPTLRASSTPPPAGRPVSAWRFHRLVPRADCTLNQRCLHVSGTATPTAVLGGGLVGFDPRRQHTEYSWHRPMCHVLTRTTKVT